MAKKRPWLLLQKVIAKGGGLEEVDGLFRGVEARVDEKWTGGEGGSKKAEILHTYYVHSPISKLKKLCNFFA